jgi:hypothetical protein
MSLSFPVDPERESPNLNARPSNVCDTVYDAPSAPQAPIGALFNVLDESTHPSDTSSIAAVSASHPKWWIIRTVEIATRV